MSEHKMNDKSKDVELLFKAVRHRILYLAKINDLKISQVAARAGIRQSTLSEFMRGNSNGLRIVNLYRVCRHAFDMSLMEFFNDSIFDDSIMNNDMDTFFMSNKDDTDQDSEKDKDDISSLT
ncbi:hypothetical protein JCM21714_2110 [Gracilibacillus boraciitolerans JCM 21714]|uniref:HTH cro/C1-type domain-containing protein n=1 Tax=Gracilibacillus boraciitolerans JCM 21714 TaxID=1298598 RepID=W4VJS3_9BACI|nr:helix-turn-helix transcriptional regulator [Gracilibacillus boraciitolerans]GAE93073.1 hypothetical protein JCM21714_2110 [Gracilibacillus boraciitolerans JCM 21714]